MNQEPQAKGLHTVVLAHPDGGSFNAALAHAYCDAVRACGQSACIRDLYALGFDPLLKNGERPDRTGSRLAVDVRAELDALSGSDAIILVYPIWFGMPPAMLKGYIDRVIGAGVTPEQVEHRSAKGPLTAGRLLSITTSGASNDWLHEQRQIESLRDLVSLYLFRTFSMKSADHLHFGGIEQNMTPSEAELHLSAVTDKARTVCERIAVDRFGAAPSFTIFDGS